jgi:hypothetical protein
MWEEHLTHLQAVFDRIKQAELTVKAKKCQLPHSQYQYLGHVVGSATVLVHPEPSKIRVVESFEIPQETGEGIGLTGYYRRLICSRLCINRSPLSDLTRKLAPTQVVWNVECDRAFHKRKEKLCVSLVLRSPNFQEFVLQTDASVCGIGVVLSQLSEDGPNYPVALFSTCTCMLLLRTGKVIHVLHG